MYVISTLWTTLCGIKTYLELINVKRKQKWLLLMKKLALKNNKKSDQKSLGLRKIWKSRKIFCFPWSRNKSCYMYLNLAKITMPHDFFAILFRRLFKLLMKLNFRNLKNCPFINFVFPISWHTDFKGICKPS